MHRFLRRALNDWSVFTGSSKQLDVEIASSIVAWWKLSPLQGVNALVKIELTHPNNWMLKSHYSESNIVASLVWKCGKGLLHQLDYT